jgi:hypothetical protein
VVNTVLNSIERHPFETSLDKINPSLKSQAPAFAEAASRRQANIQIISNHDEFVKSCHSRENGNPEEL